MNEMQRYFVEEFAEEYHEGHMSRRDLRRVLLITGGVASAATTLLALGCGSDNDEASTGGSTPSPAVGAASTSAATAARVETASPSPAAAAASPTPGSRGASTMPPASNTPDLLVREDDPAIQAQAVQFPGPAGTVLGYLARPRTGTSIPAVILVHENQGLVEPNMDIARRYAKEGFAALAVDLVSREGGTEKFASDRAQISAILGRIPQTDLATDLAAGITYLKTLDGIKKDGFGVSGFCFGGAMTFALATASPEIRAAVPYYGNARIEDLPKSQAAFLIFYGETDTRITGQSDAVAMALRGAGRTVDVRIQPGAGHAFFRNGGNSYTAAARDAWPRTLEWFARYL
jgi:carboxymethylenebutenolidase